MFGINHFIRRSMRVLRVSYRPRHAEFVSMLKVTSTGMVLIGIIGYIITAIFGFLE